MKTSEPNVLLHLTKLTVEGEKRALPEMSDHELLAYRRMAESRLSACPADDQGDLAAFETRMAYTHAVLNGLGQRANRILSACKRAGLL